MHLLYASNQRIDAYLVKALREAGHVVETTDEPADVEAIAEGGGFQALVIDWSTLDPGLAVRFAAIGPLVVMIGAEGGEAERTAALTAGADACFVRPIAFIELESRLGALERLVRRTRPAADSEAVELIAAERAVRVGERRIALSGREFQLLAHLAGRAGEVVGLDQLGLQVWGETADPRPELVRASVWRLRRKLAAGGAGELVRPVAGHGYVFQPHAAAPN